MDGVQVLYCDHVVQHRDSILIVGLMFILSATIALQLWTYLQPTPDLHSQVMHWGSTKIAAGGRVGDFVDEWMPSQNVKVVRIQVWMGNPNGVTWEGDTYVVKNRSNLTAPDSLLAHYQFDKHAESPVPHQLTFDLEPGFRVAKGEKLSVWRRFVNTSTQDTTAGDGEVIIYYVYV